MTFTPTVLTDCYISINSNVLSDHGNKAEIPIKAEGKMTTAFGATYQARIGGLKDGTLNLTFMNDFASSNLDSIMWPLVGTVVPFEIRPTSSARSVTNPAYTGNVLIDQWTPITGKVGDLVEVSVGWPTSGAVTRATS